MTDDHVYDLCTYIFTKSIYGLCVYILDFQIAFTHQNMFRNNGEQSLFRQPPARHDTCGC